MKGFLISALASSSGKTTLSALLIAYLRRERKSVAPYKVGPDFIDTQYLQRIAARPAYNLDPWMARNLAGLKRSFLLGQGDARYAVVEGAMGLFDGKRGEAFGAYSSASVAKSLGLPVLLVLQARKAGQSLAAQVLGLQKADPKLKIAGVILNECSGKRHFELLDDAIRKLCKIPCFGYLPRLKDLELLERHLGLVASAEESGWERRLQGALSLAERSVDFPGLLKVLEKGRKLPGGQVSKPKVPQGRLRVAYALDKAFHFYYQENLDLWRSLGADLLPFSPLDDKALPEGCQGLLLGGGFPENFGERLQKNEFIRREIGAKVLEGLPVWAECGGLMYLAASLTDLEGKRFSMAVALAADVLMTKKLQNFGYAEAKMKKKNPLLGPGLTLRGHEFHHSEILFREKADCLWSMEQEGKESRPEAYRLPKGIATYFHAFLPSAPSAAEGFLRLCRGSR